MHGGQAGQPRDHGAQEGGEAGDEDGDRASAVQLVERGVDALLAFAQRAELQQLAPPALADGVAHRVADDGADARRRRRCRPG